MAQSARLISELRKNLLALNSGTDAVSSSLRRLRTPSACCLVPNWIACTCGTQSCSRRNIASRRRARDRGSTGISGGGGMQDLSYSLDPHSYGEGNKVAVTE